MAAYKPVIERELKEKFNAKMLMLYTFPKQQFFCNFGSKDETNVHLKDLEGRKLRTYSTSIGDFIEGLGGSAVTIPFAEVVPALQRGCRLRRDWRHASLQREVVSGSNSQRTR